MKQLTEMTLQELQAHLAEVNAEIARRNAENAPLPEDALKVDIAQGYIDQRDLGYEDHRRGTNYIAVVKFAPSQPGGLDRTFFGKGSGSFRGVPDDLQLNDVIEVAHDYTSGGGNRSRRRDYYSVIRVDADALYLAEAKKPTK